MRRNICVNVLLVGVLVGVLGGRLLLAGEQEQRFTGCLTGAGLLVNVAVGDAPLRQCSRNATQVSWNAQGQAGVDGEPCTVAEDPEGTFSMSCPDGSAVSWVVPPVTAGTVRETKVVGLGGRR